MPKINKVAADTNGPPVVTPEQIADDLAELTTLKTESRRIAGKISAVLKQHEKAGGNRKALMALHDAKKLDPDEAIAQERARARYMAIHGLAEWVQKATQGGFDLGGEVRVATGKAAERLAAARAHADGYNSGKLGGSMSDNPFAHKPGSEEFVAWLDGRDDGERDRTAAGKGPVASTRKDKGRVTAPVDGGEPQAPKRRGRPPKAKPTTDDTIADIGAELAGAAVH